MRPSDLLTLDIEKPTAGGRMLARHGGHVVLVWGAIPGERVTARVERVGKGVAFAEAVEVLSASPDRRPAEQDWRCGGSVFAHVQYGRQVALKGEIIQDAFARIARARLATPPDVARSPEHGYRMRARLHARGGRIGFYREDTHELCDPAPTGQLSDATNHWIAAIEARMSEQHVRGLARVELAENVDGSERACHLDLHAGASARAFDGFAAGLTGLTAQASNERDAVTLAGDSAVTDVLGVQFGTGSATLRLRRSARAFFQGNRFLLDQLVRDVGARVASGRVVDLYAGVGLFGLSLAAAGWNEVTLVEGDPISAADLQRNAEACASPVRVVTRSVEAFLAGIDERGGGAETFVVDPPRTGLSRDAMAGLMRVKPRRIVYVSCDVATLARDARALLDAEYTMESVAGMDLFPNTAHVETIAVFTCTSLPRDSTRGIRRRP